MPLHVLLAENNPIEQRLIVALLEAAGHRADAVPDGLGAVEAARDTAYDLILMGHLSGFDGIGAMRLIRGLGGRNRVVPILSIVAQGESERREQPLVAGLDGHLAKPFRVEDLDRTLAAHLASTLAAEAA
jgi:CheY-like chemotaxis protein